MAPVMHESTSKLRQGGLIPDDAIVISGMSALLPDCHSITEFSRKLFNKENMVHHHPDSPRWELNHPELGQHYGRIPDIERFDPQFFMMNHRLNHSTDVMSKKLYEQAYQALFDAGVSPAFVYGKKVGVFVATSLSETEKEASYSKKFNGLLGCNRAMFANRISFSLNATGPSYTVETACASSLVALEKAYQAILRGECESAIVGATRCALHPHGAVHFQRFASVNPDGKTKCYDINADGQTVSEAIVALYIQKYKDARRVYAQLCYVKNSFAAQLSKEFGETYGTYREPENLSNFFRDFYTEVGIPPSLVEYIDGYGAALPDTDRAELQAMEAVFCEDRTVPLYVGSVTSNIGYTESASGLCSLVKLLLAYHQGEIPATLHCDNPRRDVNAMATGLMQIVTSHQPFHHSYTAMNSLSITGTNSHALLNGCFKEKDISRYQSDIPYLVTASGRLEVGVDKLLDHLGSVETDPEEIALLHQIYKDRFRRHLARGYVIFSTFDDKTKTLGKGVGFHDVVKRPLCFVYSGMGSQWAGMGAQLMRIPIFAAAIERCHKILEPKGFNLISVITDTDSAIFDDVLNSFVGITAIQIGLTDVLKAIGLVPDKTIGHSVGELGCAYVDECCTAEEIILLSYYRGLVSVETDLIRGSMAAVGLGFKQITKICPPEIEVACHNGPDSCTISGPVELVRKFVDKLQSQNIFAKEVQCSNIAYHSRYIAPLGDKLLQYSRDVIKCTKPRSERWLSTSVPQDGWNASNAKNFSPEYHTNNLLSPVLFEETVALIPDNAVLVEIAPHGLLQPILKRSLSEDCKNIPLTRRMHNDNALFLLEAIGKIYMEGFEMDLSALYPKVEFPVSTKTRNLSHLLSWDHTEQWPVTRYNCAQRMYEAIYKPIITIYDEEYNYLLGSVVEGSKVLPFAATLVFVWDLLAMSKGVPVKQISVQFNDVQFHMQPQLNEHNSLQITITLQRGSGRFEVTCKQLLVANGYIKEKKKEPRLNIYSTRQEEDLFDLKAADIYRMLFERGYEYSGEFRSIHSANMLMTEAKLVWQNNWVTLIDGIFQLNALQRNHISVSEPLYVNNLIINVDKHTSYKTADNMQLIDAKMFDTEHLIRCGGIMVENIISKNNPPRSMDTVTLSNLKIVPFFQEDELDVITTLYVYMQIIAENLNKNSINLLRVNNSHESSVFDNISELRYPPDVIINIIKVDRLEDAINYIYRNEALDGLLVDQVTSDKNLFKLLCQVLPSNTFIMNSGDNCKEIISSGFFNIVCISGKGRSRIELARPSTRAGKFTTTLTVRTDEDIRKIRSAEITSDQSILVLTHYPPRSGLKDLVKKLRREENYNIHMAMINAKEFEDLDSIPNCNLAFNVLDQGKWGGEYYVPYIEDKKKHTAALRCGHPGDLSTLHWVETPRYNTIAKYVTVHYAGLSIYDAKCATAEVTSNSDREFGMDYSGITDSGERVMGLVPSGSVCGKLAMTDSSILWPVPKHWSLEDSATVPFAYCYAFYCLLIKSQLSPGDSILVHGGAGALGQAIISIALANNCNVFTTVSDAKKKKFLKMMFPELLGKHIGNSRDISFKDMVMSRTEGKGCDIVVNCLQGTLKDATISCSAALGTVIDVVQIHTNENYNLGMQLIRGIDYVSVDFPSIFDNQNRHELELIRLMMSEGITCGYVRPLSRVTFDAGEVSRAFRLLAATQHRGRVLLRLKDFLPSAKPRLTYSPEVSCLLICDEEGFGLQIGDYLVQQGVKKLHLHSLQLSNYHHFKILSWRNKGVLVHISACDLNIYDETAKLIQDTIRVGPVDGVFIVAIDSVDEKPYDRVINNIDNVTRKLCPNIRHFTVISDNNGYADVCQNRSRYDMSALALQMRVKKFNYLETVTKKGEAPFNWQDAINVIKIAINSSRSVMRAHIQPSLDRSIFDEITKISDGKMNNKLEGITLEEYGFNNRQILELCNTLDQKFNLKLPKEAISNMTIEALSGLQVQEADKAEDINGLKAYIDCIHPDEILASSDMIMMPTLVYKTGMHPDEYESNQTFLCIVPGLEGHYERFKTLCERVKLPAVVIQAGFDKFNETIAETAQRLVDVIVKKLKMKRFHLLGYEFGVLLALEMGGILEGYGFTGNIYCLGGSHEDIRSELENKLGGWTVEKLQDEVVKHIYHLITGEESIELNKDLSLFQNFDEKVELGIGKLRGHVHSYQYLREVMKTIYARIQLTRHYNNEPYCSQSKIILLRHAHATAGAIPRMSQQPISIYELHASITHAPQDLRCAAIVNKHIEPAVLQEYCEKNRCESFLLQDLHIQADLSL